MVFSILSSIPFSNAIRSGVELALVCLFNRSLALKYRFTHQCQGSLAEYGQFQSFLFVACIEMAFSKVGIIHRGVGTIFDKIGFRLNKISVVFTKIDVHFDKIGRKIACFRQFGLRFNKVGLLFNRIVFFQQKWSSF